MVGKDEEPIKGSEIWEVLELCEYGSGTGYESTSRLLVPGGWIVRFLIKDLGNVSVASNFINDPQHTWNPSLQTKRLVKQTDIMDLQWGVRSYNALRESGIQTVDELILKNRDELSRIRKSGRPIFGKRCLDEIERVLDSKGLELRR